MTNSLTPAPKKRMSKGKKLALWIVGGVAGLFALIMIIGAIGIANTPGGLEAVRAEQSAAAAAEASKKAVQDAVKAEAKAAEESAKAAADAQRATEEAAKDAEEQKLKAEQAELEAKAEAAKTAHCLPVDEKMLEAISEGNSGPAITPIKGVAVKSEDYTKAYMIAMEFKMGDDKPEIGVWVSDSLEAGGGLLMAVDAQAVVNTHWPEARESSFKISSADHGVQESRDCLK